MLALIALIGCATSGSRINMDNLSRIREGETTKTEVVALLGKPWMVSLTSDGKTILMYQYTKAKTKAVTFIPVVGLMKGGMDINQQILQILFDADDVVEKYVFNDSGSEIKTGF